MSKITQKESDTLQQNLWLWDTPNKAPETLGTGAKNPLDPSKKAPGPWQKINPFWLSINPTWYAGLNFTFTLNPDPKIDDYNNVNIMTTKLISCLYNNDSLQKAVLVHERGKGGAKLHYHGLIHTTDRAAFTQSLLKVFNINTKVSHRTLVTKRCPGPCYRNQYLTYMKKDSPERAHYIFSKNKCPIPGL